MVLAYSYFASGFVGTLMSKGKQDRTGSRCGVTARAESRSPRARISARQRRGLNKGSKVPRVPKVPQVWFPVVPQLLRNLEHRTNLTPGTLEPLEPMEPFKQQVMSS